MIEHIVKEINLCMQNDSQIAALSLALTLPDACGKVCHPGIKGVGERYKKWIEEYVLTEENFLANGFVPNWGNLTAEIIYSLRCCFFHEADPTIPKKNITQFSLIWQSTQSAARTNHEECECEANGTKTISIDILFLCEIICSAALKFYREHKDQFVFQYRIISTSDQTANAFGFSNEIKF